MVLAFSLSNVMAADIPHLTLVTEESYPSNYTAEDGSISGFAVDYITYALEQGEIPFDISIYSWNRAYKLASQEENVLIFPIARTPERESSFHWLHKIMTISYYVYEINSKSEQNNDGSDYLQLSVGVMAGGITQQLVEEKGFKNIILAKDYEQLNRLIKNNRVDLVASSSFAMLVSRYEYPEGFFTPHVKLSDREIHLYYALSKQSAPELADSLQSLLAEHVEHLDVPN